MTHTKHTPGPWVIRLGGTRDKHEIIGFFGSNQHVAITTGNYMRDEESEANARLIAAAPEMLAFAQAMQEYFANNPSGYDGLREQCAAAIAKATGN